MESWIEKYRGVHPGAVLGRALQKKKLKQAAFARTIGAPAQTINAIIKGSRKLTPELGLKIDQAMGYEDSTMAILQAMYETSRVKTNPGPDVNKLRKGLFWDTTIDKIDWNKHAKYVIQRIFERGNELEKQELIRFYGQSKVNTITKGAKSLPVMAHLKKS